MSDKLLNTKILTYLKPRIIHLFNDIGQDELTGWNSGGAIRDSAGVERITQFISAGRNAASSNSNLGIFDWYSPILAWGGGDVLSLIAVNFRLDKTLEAGITLVTGNNDEGSLKQAYIAKTDWVKKYVEDQKATIQDIENLFS